MAISSQCNHLAALVLAIAALVASSCSSQSNEPLGEASPEPDNTSATSAVDFDPVDYSPGADLSQGGLVPPIQIGPDFAATDNSKENIDHDPRAHFHAHGQQVCKSGCALSNHPTENLTKQEFSRLMKAFATDPMSDKSEPLEHLLYYGKQTREMLRMLGSKPLNTRRTLYLMEQLSYTHAKISFRCIDENGEQRVFLPPTRVPLDRRHEFTMEVSRLQPLITSGTVKRVGVDRLWVRL